MLQVQYSDIIYIINQSCLVCAKNKISLTRTVYVNLPVLGKISIHELFVYGISIGASLSPPAAFAAPFAMPYLPIQLIFGHIIFVKLIAAIVYGVLTLFIAQILLSVFLLFMVFVEKMIHFSLTTYPTKVGPKDLRFVFRFHRYFLRFRTMQLLFKLGNLTYSFFFTNAICIGTVIGSCSGFITLKMFTKLVLISYCFVAILLIICFVVSLILTFLLNISYEHSKTFLIFWGAHLRRKEHKKLLRSCKPIGFDFGPYGVGRAQLGIIICDDIIRNMVMMILLDSM